MLLPSVDQAITALELLTGERAMPGPMPETTVTVESVPARRALPAARRVHTRSPRTPRARTTSPHDGSATKKLRAHNDESEIVAIVREAGGIITPRTLMERLKLPSLHALRQRTAPLLKSRKLIALGATLNRRLALPESAKEAP